MMNVEAETAGAEGRINSVNSHTGCIVRAEGNM
jgi:hypothetical protein